MKQKTLTKLRKLAKGQEIQIGQLVRNLFPSKDFFTISDSELGKRINEEWLKEKERQKENERRENKLRTVQDGNSIQ